MYYSCFFVLFLFCFVLIERYPLAVKNKLSEGFNRILTKHLIIFFLLAESKNNNKIKYH